MNFKIGQKYRVIWNAGNFGGTISNYIGTVHRVTKSTVVLKFNNQAMDEFASFDLKTLCLKRYGKLDQETYISEIIDENSPIKRLREKAKKEQKQKEKKMAKAKTAKRKMPAKKVAVSKKLGLKKMPKGATIADWKARIAELQAKIKSGKYQGHLLRRCHTYINGARYQIRQLQGVKTVKANINQGILPNFTKQLDVVRIEEMIAERLFAQLKNDLAIGTKKKSRKAS